MSWIKEIPYDEATGKLKSIYDRVKGPNNNIDNVLSIHSLRPHTLTGHMGLYKNVLHNSNNTLPKWYLETLGVYVSHLNQCSYCVDHHSAGLQRLINNEEKFQNILNCLTSDNIESFFDGHYLKGLGYAKKLTLAHRTINKSDIEELKKLGFSDGEILEINQVVSYFNYVNRTVVGLGVNTEGDIIGLSPNDSDDPNNWGHS
ncbi:peroxidase-related enzyme [Aquimarina sp. 2201CG5-10]|uniref:carboxymuconolactone decarboxylase family protein n=1 Tax=Aquimarina callyspongiae TaxID=3098150 RepID=UPI002AB3670D|nr:peroxidase-related enzyme [Aquimarina sp. 2201CG5-10]MDY8138230.1 peroxidase-related enzyme [Aquimarina sp. 2201CG5-10]